MDSSLPTQFSDAYVRLQQQFGTPAAPKFGAGALRLQFAAPTGQALPAALAAAGGQVELAMTVPGRGGAEEDLVTGRFDGLPFMAKASANGGGLEIRLYAEDGGPNARHIGPDAMRQMVDALFEHAPASPDALSNYVAHRLLKLGPKAGQNLAAEILTVVADYLTSRRA